jgi:hypothetical protein
MIQTKVMELSTPEDYAPAGKPANRCGWLALIRETLQTAMQRAGLLAAAGAIALLGAPLVHAQAIGWVWNNNPTTPGTTTPDAAYSYNSAGGSVAITRSSEGNYTVLFAGLENGENSHVQVSAYGPGSNFCMSGGWYSPDGIDVGAVVYCYNTAGNIVDNSFTLLYTARSLNDEVRPELAFLWANAPTTPSYTPATPYQFNETGGTNTVTRNGTGSYTANLPGLKKTGGTVLVTAYGDTPARCQVANWSSGASGTDVNVTCTDAAGVAADEMFDLVYSILETAGDGLVSFGGAAILAFNDKDKNPYDVSGKDSIPLGFFKMYSQRTGTGTYVWTITVSDGSWISTTALVTAYGAPGNYCSTNSWNSNSSTTTVYINCFDAAGAPADTEFTATFQLASTA